MTDSIADMLTRVRNANQAGHDTVQIPFSKIKENILKVLVDEGFLSDVQVAGEGTQKSLVAGLKYVGRRTRVMSGLARISTPGRRVYLGHEDLRVVRGGLGVTILSTSKGVMTDTQARQKHLGGEAICKVW
ncbi:MAG: 30S ribosomal protein S8 [Deltaproteobacteria bacterium CG11_big_fil_rev_8_21_14_0_20_47_16]|nr:MAG: 30S ribosomal protein S8 [Deltaproteobacteria bacterium CG11_big_fil_rev_8_21_14_0_20_47_16]